MNMPCCVAPTLVFFPQCGPAPNFRMILRGQGRHCVTETGGRRAGGVECRRCWPERMRPDWGHNWRPSICLLHTQTAVTSVNVKASPKCSCGSGPWSQILVFSNRTSFKPITNWDSRITLRRGNLFMGQAQFILVTWATLFEPTFSYDTGLVILVSTRPVSSIWATASATVAWKSEPIPTLWNCRQSTLTVCPLNSHRSDFSDSALYKYHQANSRPQMSLTNRNKNKKVVLLKQLLSWAELQQCLIHFNEELLL